MSSRCNAPLHIGGTLTLHCYLEQEHHGDHEAYATPYPTRLVWAEERAWLTQGQAGPTAEQGSTSKPTQPAHYADNP